MREIGAFEPLARVVPPRAEAAVVIETWRRHFNDVRLHSSLDYLTPTEFIRRHQPNPNRAVLQE